MPKYLNSRCREFVLSLANYFIQERHNGGHILPISAVRVLPEEDPVITGVETQYQIADEINLNCTSGKSHPASILHWYINEQQIQTPGALIEYPVHHHHMGLVSSTLGLRFKVSEHHFRGGSMKIKCVASIAPILYRSEWESIVQAQKLPIKEMREALLLVRSSTSRVASAGIAYLLLTNMFLIM